MSLPTIETFPIPEEVTERYKKAIADRDKAIAQLPALDKAWEERVMFILKTWGLFSVAVVSLAFMLTKDLTVLEISVVTSLVLGIIIFIMAMKYLSEAKEYERVKALVDWRQSKYNSDSLLHDVVQARKDALTSFLGTKSVLSSGHYGYGDDDFVPVQTVKYARKGVQYEAVVRFEESEGPVRLAD